MAAVYYKTSGVGGGAAPSDAQFLTLATDGDLSAERVFTAGTGIGVVDAGANSTYTVSLSHLGFESLVDPNNDRIAFWDDSAGAFAWLTVGTGLSLSGTTLTATGGGSFSIDSLAIVTLASNDYIAIADTSDANNNKKVLASDISAIVDHDATTNFVSNEHIDHTSVTLTAGVGLTGGGDISSNVTFDLHIPGLTGESAIVTADTLAFYDATALAHRKVTFGEFEAALNHDNLAGFVANEHIDWTSASSNFSTTGTAQAATVTATGSVIGTTAVQGAYYRPISSGNDVRLRTLNNGDSFIFEGVTGTPETIWELRQLTSTRGAVLDWYYDAGNGDYFTMGPVRADEDNFLLEKKSATDPQCNFVLMTQDQNGTSDCFFSARAKAGTSHNDSVTTTDESNLVIGYIAAESSFALKGAIKGSGTAYPISIYTNNHSDQIVVETNGGISLAIQGTGELNITGLPTSSAGLSSGDVWSNSGVLTIVT